MKKFILIGTILFLPGCHWGEMVKVATTPDVSGDTPIGALVREIPRAIAGDPVAIVGIITSIIGLAGVAITGHYHGKIKEGKRKIKTATFAASVLPTGTTEMRP